MDILSQVLQNNNSIRAARSLGQRYQGLADNSSNFTVGNDAGGHRVNWGDIIAKGVGSYMGQKQERRADDLEQQNQQLNEQFMRETLNNDPQMMKLYNMARMGVPGAGEKLGELVAPKKQPLATATQFFAANPDANDEVINSMAAEMGYSPELIRGIRDAAVRGRDYESKRKDDESAQEFGQRVYLTKLAASLRPDPYHARTDPNSLVGNTGLTYGEFMQLPPEQRHALMNAGKLTRESTESKEDAKLRSKAREELPGVRSAISNMKDIIGFAANATPTPGIGGLLEPRLTRNRNNVMLKQAINQLVLDATSGKLGGGVSNADVQFLKDAMTNLSRGGNDDWVAQLRRGMAGLVQKAENYSKLTGEPLDIDLSGLPAVKGGGPEYGSANEILNKYEKPKQQKVPSFDDLYNELTR